MAIQTHRIGDVQMNIVSTETEKKHIAFLQSGDVIILSMDQVKEIAAIINEV